MQKIVDGLLLYVNHHTGGLENPQVDTGCAFSVNHHTGGLEIIDREICITLEC